MAVSAIVREFRVIGEAARMMSDEYKSEQDSIPWKAIAGLRNRVLHEYFRIDLDIFWQTVEDSIQDLITRIAPLIPDEENDEK